MPLFIYFHPRFSGSLLSFFNMAEKQNKKIYDFPRKSQKFRVEAFLVSMLLKARGLFNSTRNMPFARSVKWR